MEYFVFNFIPGIRVSKFGTPKSVISMTFHAMMGMPDFLGNPGKLRLVKYELDIHDLVSFTLSIFFCAFSAKLIFMILVYRKQ